ncbi:MAG TPA: ADP-ribosylglycohydrolase family protein, partial [Ktedonobacterales bacterium]|nr:ADP-ribosylglycohydrolase family protein [Ktedonobacterales bacterium]
DRVAGGLVGLLVGDALGVPYEFHRPEAIPPREQIELDPPAGFARSHPSAPRGAWSDDGAQALCLLASLLESGRFDAEDFGRRIVRWYDEGYGAVEGKVFDVGIQTGRAIQRLRAGVPALEAGSTEEQALGNGSLMRVLPLALWHRGTDAELVAAAQAQSRVTHGHPRAQVCCALYCLWARRLLDEAADPWGKAVATLRVLYSEDSMYRQELESHVRPDDEPEGKGGGYVVDAIRSAHWAVGQGTYELAVKSAIALGNDTDTTTCLAGGIAGVRDGIEAIPKRWREGLAGKEIFQPLLGQLLQSPGP